MGKRIELPQLPAGQPQEQLKALYSYLYQMADALNNNLAEIGNGSFTDAEMKVVREITGQTETGDMAEAETLKSLIIKTAQLIKSEIDAYNLKLVGTYEADGKLGRYVRKTRLDVDVTPTGIQQNYTFQEIIQGLKTYEINAKNYIKTGLLRTVSSVPVYGVAIGKDVVTFSSDGTETYNDGNKVAELTADELSFWQNGNKIASYTGTAITLYSGSSKRVEIDGDGVKLYKGSTKLAEFLGTALKFYYNGTLRTQMDTDGIKLFNGSTKLAEFLSSALNFYYNGTLRTQMDTNGVTFYNGTTKLAELLNTALKFYHAGELRTQTDANGMTFYKGATKLAELLSSALKFYYNGTLRTQMDTNGVTFYNGSTKLAELTGTELSFYAGGTKILTVDSNGINTLEDLNIGSGKKIKIGNWTFDSTTIDLDRTYNSIDYRFRISTSGDSAVLYLYNLTDEETAAVFLRFVNGYTYYQGSGTGKVGTLDTPIIRANEIRVTDLEYRYIHQLSSREFKHDIRGMESCGERLDRLRPVTFVYDDDPEEKTRQGLIYEEALDVMPEICTGIESAKAISYMELVPMMLKEIQELRARVKALEERGGE